MTATGSYDYSEVSFIGTVDFNNASGGAVTIEVENGVDYTTSGSPLPTIIEPQIYQSVTISGAVAGSLLQVYDTTNSEQLSSPSVPLKITGGYGTDATTEKFEDLVDTTGGISILCLI
jgi:hypothetical protein